MSVTDNKLGFSKITGKVDYKNQKWDGDAVVERDTR